MKVFTGILFFFLFAVLPNAAYTNDQKVIVESFEWFYAKPNAKKASIRIKITNNSSLSIKRVELSVSATNKGGVKLESGNRSIEKIVYPETLPAGVSKTITVHDAFSNQSIASMQLINTRLEFENGSIQMIKGDKIR